MASLTDDFGSWLTDNGFVGGATGWTLAKNSIPADPDKVVALMQFGGRYPLARAGLDRPTLQINVRGEPRNTSGAVSAADAKIHAIFRALAVPGVFPLTISGTSYRYAHAQQSPFQLRHDENERPEWVVNFEIGLSR